MARVLVLGGAGFLGTHLTEHLVGLGHETSVADNLSCPGSAANLEWLQSRLGSKIVFHRIDVRTDHSRLARLVDSTDVLVHLVGESRCPGVENPRAHFETNVVGAFNVLECIRHSKRSAPAVVHVSTSRVYGRLVGVGRHTNGARTYFDDGRAGIDESTPLDFSNPSGCSQGAADQYVLDYSRTYDLDTVVLRLSNVYGPHEYGRPTDSWPARLTAAAISGEPAAMEGDGRRTGDYLAAEDLARVVARVVENVPVCRGEVYNVGGGPASGYSNLEMVELVEKLSGREIELKFVEAPAGEPDIYITDNTKIGRHLDWHPECSVARGISNLIRWMSRNAEAMRAMVSRPAIPAAEAVPLRA